MRHIGRAVVPAGSIAAILLLFEVLSRTSVLPPYAFPSVSVTLRTLLQELGTAAFWADVLDTLTGWATGLGLALAVGVPLGLLIGLSTLLYHATRVIIEFLRPMPSVALVPLAVLLFGTGLETKVFLVFFAALWPILFQSIYGAQSVDAVARDTVKVYGLGKARALLWLTLPSAMPYIATGVRISSAIALVLAIVAEIVAGSAGLGRAISVAQQSAAVPLAYALIIFTGVLGWMMNSAFLSIERRLLYWTPNYRLGT